MKLVIFLTAVFLSIFFITQIANACTPLSKPLVYGMSGPDVERLQLALIIDGHDIPAGITGYYGTQTRAAVSAFQVKYMFQILFPLGLTKPTGNVYSMTLKQINLLYCI